MKKITTNNVFVKDNAKGRDGSTVQTAVGDAEGGDGSAIRTYEGNAKGGDSSAVRTGVGNAEGGGYSAVLTADGDAEGGDNSAIRTHVGNAKGGDYSAVRTYVGNAKGGDYSVARTSKGNAEGGDYSAVLGTQCKIGDNSVGLCIDNSGNPTEIVVSCEKTVPITYGNQSSNWCEDDATEEAIKLLKANGYRVVKDDQLNI